MALRRGTDHGGSCERSRLHGDGAYGKPLAKVYGAPIRLATPWKYGFKSAKSIAKISFVDTQPTTFWQQLGPDEYGFWANVNPEVPHPRWSQATETFLNTGDRRLDHAAQRLWRRRSPRSTRGSRKSRSICEGSYAGSLRCHADRRAAP